MNLQNLKKYNLPDKPGVYFFLAKASRGLDPWNSRGPTPGNQEVLYIGKATSLKSRVRSYFAKDLIETRGSHIVDMVFKADSIKWQETDSVLEALILEANLIKEHQPYYNTREKDDKSFNYVCITKENKLRTIRGKDLKQTKDKFKKTFGPFTNGGQLREALKIIRKFFPYIEERKGAKGKEEFYKQIKLMPESSEENKRNIQNIILFFEGKKKRIITELSKEMKLLAKEKKFEEANEIKKKIFALNHINDVALIKNDDTPGVGSMGFSGSSPRNENQQTFRIEAYDIAHMSGKNMVGVMTVVTNGEVDKNEYRKFKIKTQSGANDTGALLEVLERRFTHTEWQYPKLVVIDGGVAQLNTAKKFFEKVELFISIVSVLKDERHRPKNILGDKNLARKYEKEIILANSEAHRFAINYHKQKRNKNFLDNEN